MEPQDIKKVLEAVLFVTEQPLNVKTLSSVFDSEIPKDQIQLLLEELVQDYKLRGSALEVHEIAGGWQIATRPEFASFVRKLYKDRLTYRLSVSALETLTIVAYKQPITRNEIEEIRGVEVAAVLDTLVERKLVKIAGRKETIGRPLLYGTTTEFLRAFGLRRLEDLPAIDSLVPPPTTEPDLFTSAETVNAEEGVLIEPTTSAEESLPGAVEAPTESAPAPDEKVVMSGELPVVPENQN